MTEGEPRPVRGDDLWVEAARRVLRIHLTRSLARVPGVIAGEDPEEVHAMRVATRRMRAAWRVFGDGFERDARCRYLAELRELGGRLGAVRDLDVLIEILLRYQGERDMHARAALEPLAAAWRTEREARRAELVTTLGSERMAAFVRDYQELTQTPGLAAVPVVPHRPAMVRERMPATIWLAYGRVWAFDGGLAEADLPTLHELRIAAKWLRYTLELVRELLEPESSVLIPRLVALQDQLGLQHDLHVCAEMTRGFLTTADPPGRDAEVLRRFVTHLDRGTERMRLTLGPVWRPIVSPRYRRALGEAIARL